jgi:hypothetical protein
MTIKELFERRKYFNIEFGTLCNSYSIGIQPFRLHKHTTKSKWHYHFSIICVFFYIDLRIGNDDPEVI